MYHGVPSNFKYIRLYNRNIRNNDSGEHILILHLYGINLFYIQKDAYQIYSFVLLF